VGFPACPDSPERPYYILKSNYLRAD